MAVARLTAAILAAGVVTGCGGGTRTSRSSTHADTPTASYATLVGAGASMLARGNTNAAAQLFHQAIAKDPTLPVAYYDLGVVDQQVGDRPSALHQYDLALVRDRSYTPALYNEAVLYAAHDAPLAMFDYRQVIAFKPDSPTALLNLGLLENGHRATRPLGVRDLRRALALDHALRRQLPGAVLSEIQHYRGKLPPDSLPARAR